MPVEIKYVLKIRLLKEKSCEPLCVTVWKYGPWACMLVQLQYRIYGLYFEVYFLTHSHIAEY